MLASDQAPAEPASPIVTRRDHMPAALFTIAAVLTAAVLVLHAGDQIYDSNLLHLFEATALLAGDHPYRDFYEWGAPLPPPRLSNTPLVALAYPNEGSHG